MSLIHGDSSISCNAEDALNKNEYFFFFYVKTGLMHYLR